ncbi:MAG: LAGLIDADG family homing endonuclease [Dehalococcoidia bacterium]
MTQLSERPETTEEPNLTYSDIQLKIFRDRYAFDGELFPHEAWQRVAAAVAGHDPETQGEWTERFFDLLNGFKYIPGGRIIAAMGTGAGVTAQNCYVLPSPEDSREGIMSSLSQWVEIQSKGGGVGINMSSLRPRGDAVKGVNGTSSGPVNWAQPFAFISKSVIIQGGSRRGAAMIMLDVDHPDVLEFIHAKETPGVLEGCNVSVCLTDGFMEAVKRDGDWSLQFGGRVYRTLPAREIWDAICEAAWASAEPGIYFMERANKEANSGYFETLISTNPCVTGDTWVQTAAGPMQVSDLVGNAFLAVVDGELRASGPEGFFRTGHKNVIALQTREGYRLRLTPDHLVRRAASMTRYRVGWEWVPASDLMPGDRVKLHDHSSAAAWVGRYSFEEGYLLGLLVGDGTLKADKAVLSVWDTEAVVNGSPRASGAQSVMAAALDAALTLPHRSDFTGWTDVGRGGEHRLALGALRSLALETGMRLGDKAITPTLEGSSSDAYRGFLRGLFDADGTVGGTQQKGVSVRLSQSDLDRLEAVQRMLLRLGIASSIYRNRRAAGTSNLPDGKGGIQAYATKAQHELVISEASLVRFAREVGFADTDKSARLDTAIAAYRRQPNRERFVATVESVTPAGSEDVYDVQVPGVNAFDANGLYVHNCGEQPLGAYGACLLGSFNLDAFMREDSTGAWTFDYDAFRTYIPFAVRFNDNVVDLSHYPVQECEDSQQTIRRMGIGVMGLADCMLKMKIRYGSEESIAFTESVFRTLRDESYAASVELSKERGPFPAFTPEYLRRPFIKRLPYDIQQAIANHGIRNCYLLTQAPTGTTSLLSGVNSGIEPYFNFIYERRDRTGEYDMVSAWADMYEQVDRPDWLVCSKDIAPEDHVLVQAAAQRFNDSSISKTANAPHDHTVEGVKKLYMMAYDEGLKSISYYRDGSRQEQVLYHKETPSPADAQSAVKAAEELLAKHGRPIRRKLPDERQAITHKFRVGEQEGYMTVGLFADGTPGEVFINISKQGSTVSGLMDSVAMLTSYALQYGVPLEEIANKMKNSRFEPSGPTGNKAIPIATSIVDYVFRWLQLKFGDAASATAIQPTLIPAEQVAESTGVDMYTKNHSAGVASGVGCPDCGAVLYYGEGCLLCRNCGYNKCG